MIIRIIVLIIFICGVLTIAVGEKQVRKAIVKIDRTLFDNNLRYIYGYISGETWDEIEAIDNRLQFDSDFILVGHGGGFRGEELENTYKAADISRGVGLKVFEIDLVLNNNVLFCEHDAPTSLTKPCDLRKYLRGGVDNQWLILDIKTDFGDTIEYLSGKEQLKSILPNLIVQIYLPHQFEIFEKVSNLFGGYLVSVYKSKRPLAHVCMNLEKVGIRNIVINTEQIIEANKVCANSVFFIHPLKSCSKLKMYKNERNIKGAFVSGNAISC